MTEGERVEEIIAAPLWREHALYQNVIILRDDKFDANAFGITAPEFGSGKSFLVDNIHMVAFGTTAPVIDATQDDDEFPQAAGNGTDARRPRHRF
jgi:hypothetical protein